MSFFSSPKIVTNGLALCLDAASIKSYPRAGTTWNGLAGNGNSGVLLGNAIFSGVYQGAMSFTGGGNRIIVGTSDVIAFNTAPFTIETWIQPSLLNVDAAGYAFFEGRPTAGNGAYPTLYIDTAGNSNVLRYYVSSASRIAGPTLTTGNWYHVVAARTGTATNLYVNTALVGIWSADVTSYLPNTPLLGTYDAGGGNFTAAFRGLMPVCRVYSGVGLTQAQVTQNYNAQRGRFLP